MNTMKHGLRGVATGCALLVAGMLVADANAAETCVWTGGGGDGLWSTAANWQGGESPSAETKAVSIDLSELTAAFTLINDINGLSVQTLALTSDTQKVTFMGNSIAVSDATTFSTGAFQLEAPLAGAGTVDFFCDGQLTLSGANSADATGAWTIHKGNLLVWKIAYPFGQGPVRIGSGVSMVFRRDEELVNDFTLCGNVNIEANAGLVFKGVVTAAFETADEKLTFKTSSQSTYSGALTFVGGLMADTSAATGIVALDGSLAANTFTFAKVSNLAGARLTYGRNVTIDLCGNELRTAGLSAALTDGACVVQSTGGAATLVLTGESAFAAQLGADVRLVAEGCAVTLTDGTCVAGADLGVAKGGTFVVPDGVEVSVGRFYVDDVAVRPGRFSAADAAFVTGNGILSVTRYVPVAPNGTELVWKGGTDNDDFRALANWGVATADLDSGATAVSFGASGTARAVVSAESAVQTMAFARPDDFTVDGNATLWLHEGGLSVASGSAATIKTPLALAAAQGWTVASDAATLDIGSAIRSSAEAGVIEVSGGGAVTLRGDNRDMMMPFVFRDMGTVAVFGTEAFAATNRASVFVGTVANAAVGPVYAAAATNDTPIAFELGASPLVWSPAQAKETLFVQRGAVTLGGSGQMQMRTAGASWELRGGLSVTNANVRPWIQVGSGDTLRIAEAGWALGSNAFTLDDGGTVFWGAPVTSGSQLVVNKTRIVMECADVWKNLTLLTLGKDATTTDYATLDLNGFDQQVNQIRAETHANTVGDHYSWITSATPAVLSATGGSGTYTKTLTAANVRFTGAVGFAFEGLVDTSTLVFRDSIGETSGALAVKKGVVRLTEGSGWRGEGSRVEVSGTGTLEIDATAVRTAFPRKCKVTLAVSESGKVLIPDGATVSVRWLEIDGKRCMNGYYGGSESIGEGVVVDSVHFGSGTGRLHVCGDIGTMMLIR